MLSVVLSIALLVLLSVAVIVVVADEGKEQPRSGRGRAAGSEPPETVGPTALDVAVVPPPVEAPEPAPARAAVEPARPDIAASAAIALPRHRFRSSVLLVLYVLVAGVLLAAMIGAAVAGLTVLLRDAVTS